jgi:hypothetical protein
MTYVKHRAAISVLLASLSVCISAGTRSQTSPQTSGREGLQLLHKMQTALGGAEKIAAIYDYEETVRAEALDVHGARLGEVRKRTRWMRRPNLLRLDQVGPRGTYVLYFDARSGAGWEILPDLSNPDPFKTTGKSIELAGGELKFATNYLWGFQLSMWIADRTPGYTVTSPAANVLRIEHDHDATDFTLDPDTWRPVKTSSVSLANPDRPVSAEMRYEGWTEVAGVWFPTRRANYHNRVKLGEINETAIHVNVGLLAQKLATKPPDFAPDIPRH